jgi:hypothetical protein
LKEVIDKDVKEFNTVVKDAGVAPVGD